MVKCVQAVLEHHDKMEDNNLPFLQSLDILARSQSDKLDQSTKLAKIQLELVVKQVQNVIDTKQVISAGPFLYTIIQEGTPNSQYYCRPTVLTFLAQFLLQAHVSFSQSKKVTKDATCPYFSSRCIHWSLSCCGYSTCRGRDMNRQ